MATDPTFPTTQRILDLVKHLFLTAPKSLEPYITENFGTDLKGERAKQRNKTKRLRLYKGNLQRAVTQGEDGNISTVEVKEGKLQVSYGVDLKVVPYARIHELGGTIKHPGGTPYMFRENGRAVWLRKGDKRAIGKTKAHPIEIPKRPYLAPGMKRWQEVQLPRFIKRLMDLLDKEM